MAKRVKSFVLHFHCSAKLDSKIGLPVSAQAGVARQGSAALTVYFVRYCQVCLLRNSCACVYLQLKSDW